LSRSKRKWIFKNKKWTHELKIDIPLDCKPNHSSILILFFFFGENRIWTHGFVFQSRYSTAWTTPQSTFCSGFVLKMGTICPGWPWTTILLISVTRKWLISASSCSWYFLQIYQYLVSYFPKNLGLQAWTTSTQSYDSILMTNWGGI
jgi:hypothetical protein